MCTVLLPPGDNPIAVNKYIISYNSAIFEKSCPVGPIHVAVHDNVVDVKAYQVKACINY